MGHCELSDFEWNLFLRLLANPLATFVQGTIIHDDEFEIPIGLIQDAIY